MPPSSSTGSLGSISRSWIFHNRNFSTKNILLHPRPEHPNFIEVPGQPPIRHVLRQNEVKGTIPPPRNVLKTRALATPKHLNAFRLATTPEPKNLNKLLNGYAAWKKRMAEIRRNNLREAITELNSRQMERRKILASITLGKRRRREMLLHAPQRKDEHLTNPTIRAFNSELQTGILPDPNREARLKVKADRYIAREEAKKQARKDALHTLYMNARDFIVTEEQLESRIEKIFTDQPFFADDLCDNIWEAFGAPATIKDYLRNSNKLSKSALQAYESPAVITGERMRKIAENLTGGKMESLLEKKIN